jgi:anti-sigma-K factor RskA
MNHDALRELTGAYALGALGAEEKRALEAHLASCAECAAEVRAFGEVARGLDQAVPQIDPPASLRGRVIARVEGLAAKSTVPPVVLSRPESTERFPGTVWLALAASLIAGVLGFYALSLRNRVQVLEGELTDARKRAAAAELVVQTIEKRADNLQRTSDIVRAADVVDFKLKGTGPGSAASGRAFVSRSRGVVFIAQNLPPLDPGKTYQLWVINEDDKAHPLDAGIFAPDASGAAAITTALNVSKPATVAVTLEPAGGVPAPTGGFYLLGSL